MRPLADLERLTNRVTAGHALPHELTALRATPVGQFLNGLFLLFVALALVNWVVVARLVRGQVLSLRE
ncbi:MAG: ABC transporter permease, partial [Chloroflexi bacterium]|nr:ABC transporter permease [Chloroflexota bacterium]